MENMEEYIIHGIQIKKKLNHIILALVEKLESSIDIINNEISIKEDFSKNEKWYPESKKKSSDLTQKDPWKTMLNT